MLKLTVAPALAQADYDATLFRRGAEGELLEMTRLNGGAGTEVGQAIDPPAGEYVLRVFIFRGAGGYTATVEFAPRQAAETYTLQCLTGAGHVVRSQDIVVDRGQMLAVDPCRAKD